MRKPNIFQQKKKKKEKETLFSYISCGSTIVFDDDIQRTCLYTSLGLKLGPNVYMEYKIYKVNKILFHLAIETEKEHQTLI